jgi:hypothetical protein
MSKPKLCSCGGAYKKSASPPNPRDGSRYFRCDRCHAQLERTANGYEFKDEPPAVSAPPLPAPPRPR